MFSFIKLGARCRPHVTPPAQGGLTFPSLGGATEARCAGEENHSVWPVTWPTGSTRVIPVGREARCRVLSETPHYTVIRAESLTARDTATTPFTFLFSGDWKDPCWQSTNSAIKIEFFISELSALQTGLGCEPAKLFRLVPEWSPLSPSLLWPDPPQLN